VKRFQDLHPDDTEARVKLRLQLRDVRRQAGYTVAEAADRIGITKGALSLHERRGDNPLVASVQRNARGFDHRLHLRPELPHRLAVHPTAAVLRDLAAHATDPHDEDAYHRSAILADLAAYRRWVGITARDMSGRWGTRADGTAVCDLEQEVKEPLLASFQRYTRALGGVLHIDLEPL
jgi:transcriptional regulator with XRE-family HTH domain